MVYDAGLLIFFSHVYIKYFEGQHM